MTIERHSVLRHLRMVCFDDGADRFQMRAAGIAIRDGRVLVQNVSGDPVASIPGGRIDQHESSTETVIREMQEEFGLRVETGPLAFVIESFFPEKDQVFHEIGFYYPIAVPKAFPFDGTGAVCHRFREGPVVIEYRWIETTPAALAAGNLYPVPLRSRLAVLPVSTVHLVERNNPVSVGMGELVP
jgi:8-oxo-dGTP pyrophosphatase MutT (NUDIX family)